MFRSEKPAAIDDDPERGAAMLIATMFGALATLVVLVLVGRVVTKQRAVARSLAETRAYWAAQGINNYVLSRTMQMGDCDSNYGNATVLILQNGYAAEISELQTWQYPDVSPAYQFKLISTVSESNLETLVISTARVRELRSVRPILTKPSPSQAGCVST